MKLYKGGGRILLGDTQSAGAVFLRSLRFQRVESRVQLDFPLYTSTYTYSSTGLPLVHIYIHSQFNWTSPCTHLHTLTVQLDFPLYTSTYTHSSTGLPLVHIHIHSQFNWTSPCTHPHTLTVQLDFPLYTSTYTHSSIGLPLVHIHIHSQFITCTLNYDLRRNVGKATIAKVGERLCMLFRNVNTRLSN